MREKKEPRRSFLPRGSWYWQRPTLAQPRDALPSANARFTSVFGMGTGGATLLRSPDCCGTASGNKSNAELFDRLGRVSGVIFCVLGGCQRTGCSLKIIGKGPLF